jgi:hypothetical protein
MDVVDSIIDDGTYRPSRSSIWRRTWLYTELAKRLVRLVEFSGSG